MQKRRALAAEKGRNETVQAACWKLSPCEYYKFVTTGKYPLETLGGAAPNPPEFIAFVSKEGETGTDASAEQPTKEKDET